MDRNLSDEQLDRIAKELLHDFSLNEETLDEIADSPKLWWNVRNAIEAERSRRERNWFFGLRWQIAAFSALGIILFAGIGGLFLNFNSNAPLAKVEEIQTPKIENPAPFINEKKEVVSKEEKTSPIKSVLKTETAKVFLKKEVSKQAVQKISSPNETKIKTPKTNNLTDEAKTETKTDFIALSYSSATDSGQIVRVKVPSSMMVSLGVTTESEQTSKLVNAEVVIGDDGMARAIRFIK
ncbi:MAG TPA: hypothetical protein PKY59_21525 [Pyrinomonadaceae bacterium]|nr:hypothetical protein [Pyrinomonadaceae bacterium]